MPTIQAANDNPKPRELTGRTVLFCLLAFFAVVAGVNGVMIRAATSTFGGVETGSAYQAGRAFARETSAAQAQDALHWQVAAQIVPTGEGTSRLDVTARDASGAPLTGLTAQVGLAHPANRRFDHAVVLTEQGAGRFTGRSEVAPGQWDLVIELSRGGERVFRSKNRINVR